MAGASRTNAAIAITGANVPATVTALTARVLKMAIGHRADGVATSYLPVTAEPQAAAAGHIGSGGLVAASVSASFSEAGVLVYADHTGRALLRLLPEHLALAPEA